MTGAADENWGGLMTAAQAGNGAVTSAAVLDQLLGTLKPAQSEAIRLVKIYGLSIEETSVRTGQSESLVKVNIHRGLSLLAKMAQQESYAEG